VASGTQVSPCIPTNPGESLRRRLVTGAFWSLVGAGVSRGLTLGASVLAGRLLGATGFGELGMIQSTQGLFGVLAGAGLGLAATKHVAEYRAQDGPRAARCIALVTRIAIATGLAAAAGLLALAPWLADSVLEAPHLVGELQLATALVFLTAVNGDQTGALAGLGDFRTIAY
jgi:O-antigen/teichoic acid export membrane protein